MKHLKTIIKVKSFEELELIEELSNINDLISNCEITISSFKDKINYYKQSFNSSINAFEQISLRAIIQTLYKDLESEEFNLQNLNTRKEDIFSNLTEVRKNIKAVEKLISKREEILRKEELYKEQAVLDELNTLD